VSVSAGARVGTLERRYLSGTFAELCRIESPSGSERACAERVIAELRALGVSPREDGAGELTGSDCGNLLARIPGRAEGGSPSDPLDRRSVLLCAHLDTVPLQAPVEPVLLEGTWTNANEGILGADNKAAIAVLLALARHISHQKAAVDVELLFTVGEERSLAGSRVFDVATLRSDFGYVFDHASPIGEIVTGSPSHYRLEASFRGAAAHAGIRPQDGRSAILAAARAVAAMPFGWIEEGTSLNVGTIAGGSALNVVAEHCTLVGELRSLDEGRAQRVAAEFVDRVHEAANLPDCDCDVDVRVERSFAGYGVPARSPALQVAEAALRSCGHEPVRISSGGGSDANTLLAKGFQTVNLANGTERAHEPGERVSATALDEMLDVALALLDEAAAHPAGAALSFHRRC
jgi:tripeptide aminopeptidase